MKRSNFDLERISSALEDIVLLIEQRAAENPVRIMTLVQRMACDALKSFGTKEDIEF